MELRRVIITAWYRRDQGIFGQRQGDWVLIDRQLCGLVDRLRAAGYRHTLLVEMQIMTGEDDPGECDFTAFLPRFREKGVVTVQRLSI